MGSQVPPGSEVGADNIAEAMRLFAEYKRRQAAEPAPPPEDTAGQGFGALFQRGFETVAKPLGDIVGGAMHVAGIPARAVAAVGTNMYEGSKPVDVSDYALYGQDMETGAQASHYGDILAGHLAESGEVAAGGTAEKLVRLAGNLITDPSIAPLLMGGAEGAASLAGRAGPSIPLSGPATRPMPRSRPAGGPMGQPAPFSGSTGPGSGFNPTRTQPLGFDPTATQPVRGTARVGGEFRDPGATQPVRTVKPTGSSMEAKFVAQRAQGRPGGALEEQFSRTRAPREANYPKGKGKKGTGAKPSGEKARNYKDRGEVRDKYPERPYPKGKTGHKVDVPERLKPKSKRAKAKKNAPPEETSKRVAKGGKLDPGENLIYRIVDGKRQYGKWKKSAGGGSEMWVPEPGQ